MTREVEFQHFNGSLFLASLWLSRQTRKRCPNSRESARISILEERKDLFSDFAPEVEEFRRGFGTGQDPNFDGVGSKVSDLKCEYALVPQFRCLNNPLGFLADLFHRNKEVNVKEDRAHEVRTVAGPVLEWLFQKIFDWNDQTPPVPHANHNVGQSDLFDCSPLSFDDHHIFDSHRLHDRDLESGNNC